MNDELAATLTNWRRHLHAHPGVTFHEGETAAFVAEKLRAMGIEVVEEVGGHGLVGTLHRPGGSNRSVGLRADMDALPIQEKNENLAWRSTIPGVMHACGHDGHTTALLGAARLLVDDPDWTGTIRLVFQPAEEGGGGAKRMIAEGLFERFPMQRMFGWHNWPGLPAGTIAIHNNAVMGASDRFQLLFEGKAGHAALPHLTDDPMLGAGHAIVALQSVVARRLDPMDTGVISVTMAEAGEAQNQIPRTALLKGSVRYLRPETGVLIEESMQRVADGIAATYGLTATLTMTRGVPVTLNHAAEADMAATVASAITPIRRDMPPAMTGEDFSRYLQIVPGAFVWIGNGPSEAGRGLHDVSYDFNDAVLPVASTYLADIAKTSLRTE